MEYMTVEQVAEQLQVSGWTVRRWLRDGELEGSYLSDRAGWRVSREAVERFLQARSNRSTGGNEPKEPDQKGKAPAAAA